jgi:hypothetical protein
LALDDGNAPVDFDHPPDEFVGAIEAERIEGVNDRMARSM